MQELWEQSEKLVADVKEIRNYLFAYNPSLRQPERKPLPAIAQDIAHLMYRLAALRVDIINEEKP